MGPFSAFIPSIRRRHFLISLICLVSILSEFLPITLANIPFSLATTEQAYQAWTYVTMSILAIMLVSTLVLIFRQRRHIRPLPRKPTTLSSVLLYFTHRDEEGQEGQAMLDASQDLSVMETWERNRVVKGWKNLYTLGLGAENDLRVGEDRRIRRLWTD
jgi:hypothetical protein